MTNDDASHEEIRQARMRAGAAFRDLGHAFVGREMTVEQVDRLSEALEEIAAELWPGVERRKGAAELEALMRKMPEGRQDPDFSDRPISGGGSPWGFDPEIHREGDEVVANVTLRSGHEGAPGRAHGGIVAALLDDVCGFVLGLIQQPAFTGELTIRYQAPTPLHRPIQCRARAVDRKGRLIYINGEIIDPEEDQIVATAKGVFIAVDGFDIPTAQRPVA